MPTYTARKYGQEWVVEEDGIAIYDYGLREDTAKELAAGLQQIADRKADQ